MFMFDTLLTTERISLFYSAKSTWRTAQSVVVRDWCRPLSFFSHSMVTMIITKLYKLDTTLRRTVGADGVSLREN